MTHDPNDNCNCPGEVAAGNPAIDICEYRMVADLVIRESNPPDQDMAEVAIVMEAIERLTAFVRAQSCTCPPTAGPPDFNDEPCQRCLALGRVRGELADR